ncbi:high mobility group box domain-containing protein [Gigaspora rosea]|uniref:High mobility group box domain-containing protein n=1 Tax=Gigaspora rosea TaxID=44941 RepID=A0A397UII7_9GLOM|nr:high mobility group box domain-containing protein [Gigaspora rosea]CAG8461917.1 23532_t:CDS:1 [Gigaspora rosea]
MMNLEKSMMNPSNDNFQFIMIISDMKMSKSILSLYNELLSIDPQYPLTMRIEDLVTPAQTSRRASQFLEKHTKPTPPRPLNLYLLFRKDYDAYLKSEGNNLSTGEVSKLTSTMWKELSPPHRYFFQILADLAKLIHMNMYPEYRYIPRKPTKARSVSDTDRSPDPNRVGTTENTDNDKIYYKILSKYTILNEI